MLMIANKNACIKNFMLLYCILRICFSIKVGNLGLVNNLETLLEINCKINIMTLIFNAKLGLRSILISIDVRKINKII